MHRALYAAGWGYVALCGAVVATHGKPGGAPRPNLRIGAAAPFGGTAGE